MKIDVEIIPTVQVVKKIEQELKERVRREFGHVEIVRTHQWAEPTWTFLGRVQSEIVSFLSVVDRVGEADGKRIRLFGLNNVITDKAHRKKGYSTVLNKLAVDFMRREDPSALGVLFCAEELIPFYKVFGWKKFTGKVTVSQPSGDKVWPSNAMVCTTAPGPWVAPKEIHLKGLPW